MESPKNIPVFVYWTLNLLLVWRGNVSLRQCTEADKWSRMDRYNCIFPHGLVSPESLSFFLSRKYMSTFSLGLCIPRPFLPYSLSLSFPPLYCNAAGFPSLHFLFGHILHWHLTVSVGKKPSEGWSSLVQDVRWHGGGVHFCQFIRHTSYVADVAYLCLTWHSLHLSEKKCSENIILIQKIF